MLHRSIAYSTMEAHKSVVGWTVPARDGIPSTQHEKLRDYLCKYGEDSAGHKWTSCTQVLPAIRCASRVTRPGMAVGFVCVVCNGLCTSKRFHVDVGDQRCR